MRKLNQNKIAIFESPHLHFQFEYSGKKALKVMVRKCNILKVVRMPSLGHSYLARSLPDNL